MHRWETVGGSSGAANKAFLGQMVKYLGGVAEVGLEGWLRSVVGWRLC